MIKIEKNIPLPKDRVRGRKSQFPFIDMEVGDSFKYQGDPKILAAAISYFQRKNTKMKFAYRQEFGGYRAWRIA